MTRPSLKIVPQEPEVVDIYGSWKREIASRDWRRVHIAADRRQPVEIASPRRTWTSWSARALGDNQSTQKEEG